ncbi:MAG: vWA domain-containing protein [Gammaproteobacteria bacterium]
MNSTPKSFIGGIYANRFGLLIFGCLTLVTAVVLATAPDIAAPPKPSDRLEITTKLSQSKLVKGEVNTVYLDVGIRTPGLPIEQSERRESDLIVVLDRSGSMSEANKMPYAKAAIRELLSRLNDRDRFALVSFSDRAVVHSPLVAVDADRREQLAALVEAIEPAGGTNIGEGLYSAVRLLKHRPQIRTTKVLLLSDGQANQGITDLTGLSHIVQQLTRQESVLSSIGMGLDFNETLMSSLADYGMGSYAYLENLAGLGELFADNLNATRNIFAAVSHLTLTLNDGIELVDAGGYPISKDGVGSYSVKTGQLLGQSDKKFVMTFNIKAQDAGDLNLGSLRLNYQIQGENLQQAIPQRQLTLAVVEPERRQEAVASIDRDVYQQSWLKNNLGRMQKKLSRWVREGNKDKAEKVIDEYRSEIAQAEEQAAMPLASAELEDQLNEMKSDVDEAFSGNRADQEVKRKRAAKSLQLGGIKEQRDVRKAQKQ